MTKKEVLRFTQGDLAKKALNRPSFPTRHPIWVGEVSMGPSLIIEEVGGGPRQQLSVLGELWPKRRCFGFTQCIGDLAGKNPLTGLTSQPGIQSGWARCPCVYL